MENKPRLIDAVWKDDLEIITRLISQGVNINEIDEHDMHETALLVACYFSSIKVVRILVENGACLETTNVHGQTCLMRCCREERLEIINYLLSQGSRINRCRQMGATALHVRGATANPKVLHTLLKSGGIMRKDEYGCSPIMCFAKFRYAKSQIYLDKVTNCDSKLQLDCQFCRRRSGCVGDPMEKMTACELLGAFNDYTSEFNDEVCKAWRKAISMRKEAGLYPAQIVNLAPTCICDLRMYSNERYSCSNQSISGDAWSVVSMAAREAISGMELLRCARKRDGMKWMPCFSCPTSPYQRYSHFVMSTSSDKSMPYRLFDEVNQLKSQRIKVEIQTVYEYLVDSKCWHHKASATTQNQFLPYSKPSQSKDSLMQSGIYYEIHDDMSNRLSVNLGLPTNFGDSTQRSSTADVILGIEPICFVHIHNHQNDVDPSSYYLLRHWLTSRCFNPPRTTYRSSYSVCTSCGKIIIHFGVAYRCNFIQVALPDCSTSKGHVCKLCIEDFGGSGDKLRKVVDTNVTVAGLHRLALDSDYIHICDQIQTSTNKTSAGMVCNRCGLVSEQHPLLQRLHKRWIEAFGDMRGFDSVDETKKMLNSSATVQLQQILICLRHLSVCDPDVIACIHQPCFQSMRSSTRYVNNKLCYCLLEFRRVFVDSQYFDEWTSSLWNLGSSLNEIDNLQLIVETLEVAVDYVERYMWRCLNGWHTRRGELNMAVDKMEDAVWFCLNLIANVLSHDYFENPFNTYTAVEAYDTTGTYEFPPAEKQPLNGNDGNSECQMKHKFIYQVRRLVFLDPRIITGASLIHLTCMYIFDDPHIPTLRLLLQLGANPDCVDAVGQTAIGCVLSETTIRQGKLIPYFITLMEGGAHLDGYKRSKESNESFRFFLRQKDICLVRHGRLACLTASFMRRNGLDSNDPIVKTYLPDCFVTFLSLH